MTPREYEQLVADLKAALVNEVDGLALARIGVGATNRIAGSSGFAHQIDISLDLRTELHLIECKRWGRVVDPAAVLALVGRLQDIAPARKSQKVTGAIATTAGFGPGAEKLAAHFGIVLELVTSAHDFVIRYRNRISAAVTDEITLGEHAVPELHPVPPPDAGKGGGAA